MNTFVSHSPNETEAFAENFAKRLNPNTVIAFTGDLGAGKTCFVRGLAKGLGFTGTVNSPTFALVNEYLGGKLPLFHFDMYRISGWEDLETTGYFDYLTAGGVLAVEWSENIENALPNDTVRIDIRQTDQNDRIITVNGFTRAD